MREVFARARDSMRLRITVVATLVFGVAFGVAAWALVHNVQDRLEDQARDDAVAVGRRVALQLEAGLDPRVVQGGTGVALTVTDLDGNVLNHVGPPPGALPSPDAGTEAIFTDTLVGEDVVQVAIPSRVGGEQVTVLASSPLASVRRSVDALAQILWLTIPLLVVGVGVLVWHLVGWALRPVAAITREVEEISHTTMHRRVSVPASSDEIHQLARTMNDMLARLEAAHVRQRAFVSDASHELRTPVATVQAALEVGLRNGDLERAARDALAANRRLQDVVTDLLDLARLDDPDAATVRSARIVDMEEVVLEHVASRGDARIDTSAVVAGRVRGDRNALERLIRNLLDNATRHARDRVVVGLTCDEHRVVLTVDDDGPGIPPADRAVVFERFVRLDDARKRGDGGTGLGLAIVRRIVEQHGGEVAITDAPLGGARFSVSLPAALDGADGADEVAQRASV